MWDILTPPTHPYLKSRAWIRQLGNKMMEEGKQGEFR